MNRIAFYDMDKTLTRRATFGPFILFVLKHHRRRRLWALPMMGIVTLGYGLKLISRSRLKEINLRLLIGHRINVAEMAVIAREFAMTMDVFPKAIAQIATDREAGYRIVLATASYRFYVAAIAEFLGIEDVIATDCVAEGAISLLPKIDGENCYAEGKLRMVLAWMRDQAIARESADIRFYSDHVSDAPCLDWADEAFAVNAHPPLKALAAERGWTSFDWH